MFSTWVSHHLKSPSPTPNPPHPAPSPPPPQGPWFPSSCHQSLKIQRHPELLILQCLSSHQTHRSFFLSISCSIFPNAFPTLSPLVKLSPYGRSSCQSALSSRTLPFDQLRDVSLDDQPHPHSRILCSPHCLSEAHRPPLGVQGLQGPSLYFQPCLLCLFPPREFQELVSQVISLEAVPGWSPLSRARGWARWPLWFLPVVPTGSDRGPISEDVPGRVDCVA